MNEQQVALWVERIEAGIKWDDECGEPICSTADAAIRFVEAYRTCPVHNKVHNSHGWYACEE